MKKWFSFYIFCLVFYSQPSFSTMYGDLGSLDQELSQLKEYKKLRGKNKCQVQCYVEWNKKTQEEDKRFSNVRYHTRSQTKKNKAILTKLKGARENCLKACK